MESNIDSRYIKARDIAQTDYSNFNNPLREILEYRKMACKELNKIPYADEDRLFEVIEYCNDALKKNLKIW